MRIIAGSRKGLALASVGKGDGRAHLRPTPDRVRESLFSLLSARDPHPIDGARVLDLFAGTGALGLEALSRGASETVFVERGRAALRLLEENITKTRFGAETTVLRQDATRLGPIRGAPFDLVFLDPPYGQGLGTRALIALSLGSWLAADALIVFEEETAQEPPEGYTLEDTRTYGRTVLTLLRPEAP